MAELYDQNKIYANRPTASSQAPQSADAELEAMLSELPPEEREAARASITAAPTGEDINRAMQERNANGEVFNMNIEQYRLWKSNNKTKEVDVLDSMGQAAEGVFNEIMAAAGSIYDKPLESTAKLTPSIVEAFAQGTRSLYGMAAQSQDPNSVFFRVKNALSANGDDEQAEFQQFMEAQEFNVQSMKLATGKETWLVDKDLINPEMTQVMSYIADPTLFVPFGGIAAKGAKMIGMGEALAKASARASQIQRKVLGGAIKWGAGAPIEFLGTATRNTIDYGLEKAGSAFEVATGMPMAEAQATAKMYGLQTASAALEGRTVGLPFFGDIAGAAVGSTTARGVGEALSMVGEQMQKQKQFGRGVLSYAGQALRDANKSGVPLSKHAKALLNVLDKVDPLFVYSADISKGAAEGMAIGGILGGLNAGEEGAASGAGAGLMLGAVGAGMGSAVSDIGKGRLYDRIAVQRQMVIEGLRNIDADKASAFEAMAKTAELSGNRDLIAQVDGIITGIDVMAPNARFVARTEKAHIDWLLSQKIDPDTGRLMEPLALFPEFGTDRKSRARALSFLSMIGNRFDGDHKLFIKELQGLPQDHALRKQFFRLSGEQKTAVFDAIDKAATPESKAIFGGKNGYEFYGQLNYAEANVARVNAMFDAGNKTQANEMIRTFLKDETVKGELTERGKLLKEKLATEGYFDKDGNMRPSRLKDVEATRTEYKNAKGFVFRRDSTGQVEIHINLNEFGKETAPHELFHAVMMDSMLKPDFIDRLSQNLLGKFDADGKRIENASVEVGQVKKFFQRYIDALHGKDSQEAGNQAQRLEAAIKEYEARGTTNKISLETKNTLEGLLEEFGAYYFGAFINNKPVDYLFRGGELGAMREVMGSAKQGFLDFWRSKIKSINPDFNFDPSANEFITQAFEKDGIRTKNKSLDLMMRDFVRATAMANKQGGFDVSRLSPAARETFVKNNGIRGLSMTRDANGNLVRSSQRKVIIEQMRTGKEIYKILSGLDPKFRQGLYTDGEGNLSGRLSPEAMEAMVQSGHIDRAWVDKIQQGYNILEGKGGNVIYFGYLGRTAQIGDYAWPRLVGSDVPFKNRAAVLVGVDFKVGKDGKMYSLFHTLDKAVIDGRADVLWSDSSIRQLWDGDRGAMEADFFRYLANASLPSSDVNRKGSAVLLEDGTGKGVMRRNALHQMLGMVKAEGEVYINKPIAEIPYGIRHSVTTFNVDGIANMRVGTDRWNIVPENAYRDLSRNFQLTEMRGEETPSGGKLIKHATGYKISKQAGEKFKVFDAQGKYLGQFDTVADAGRAAQKNYNDTFDKSVEGKDVPVPPTEVPQSRQAYTKKRAFELLDEKLLQDKIELELQRRILNEERNIPIGMGMKEVLTNYKKDLQSVQEKGLQRAFKEDEVDIFVRHSFDGSVVSKMHLLSELVKEAESQAGFEYDNLYPMEIKSALHGRIAQISQDYPNLTAQGLLKKLEVYGSNGNRYLQEATEIGLVDLLKSKIQKTTTPRLLEDGRMIEMTQGVTQPKLDMTEILDFAKSKEIKVTIEEGAKERSGMDTSKYTLGGAKDNYKQTAVRINPEYAHGISGHYGKDTIVHFRTTERIDADGNRHLFIEEVQANNSDINTKKTSEKEIQAVRDELKSQKEWLTEGIKNGAVIEIKNTDGKLIDYISASSNIKDSSYATNFNRLVDNVFAGSGQGYIEAIQKMFLGFIKETADTKGGANRLFGINNSSDYVKDRVRNKEFITENKVDNIISSTEYQEYATRLFDAYRLESKHQKGTFRYASTIIERISDTETRLQQLEAKNPVKPLPLTSAKDWTLTALKGIIRQAIRDGLDRITLTHPDDSPTVSHMKGDARQGLYGKLIPEVWGSWLRKYGIEMKQTNKLADATIDTAKGQMAEITNKLHDANKAVLEHFEQVKGGEDPAVIQHMSELLATPVHEADDNITNRIIANAADINDNKLRTLIGEVALFKGSERDAYNKVSKLREGGIRAVSDIKSDTDAGISAEAIDRGMTFELNDRLKRDFLDGKIKVHAQPTEGNTGGRVYDQNSKEFKSGFIGLWASKNPDKLKGKNIEFFQKEDGSYRIRMQDNSSGQTKNVGHITASISDTTATISSNIDPAFRGNKLSYALYSEMAERLRAMGVEMVDGQIVNKDGVPIKVREAVIGDTRDYFSGKPISQEEGARRIQERQEQVGSMGGVDVYNRLDKQGRYQPTEGGADWSKTVAEAQRDKPESAMVRVQYKLGGGLMSTVIEQAGDILHRTYERININNGSFGYETVKYKVDLALKRISDLLLNKDEFRRNAVSNFANDKRSIGTSEQHLVEVKKLLKEFGDAHAELPANNELQRRVKALNVALGNLDFNSAHRELKFLNTKLVNENTWTNFAKEGMSKENRPAFQPKEGTNATVNKANRSLILKSIQSNAKSVAALKEGQKKPEERTRNYITIDNINPDLLRDEAVVMHSPDNAGIEPVQIGRFTVQQKGGMRYPIEEFTEGWAANKEGLAKDINDLGDDNAKRGKGWWSPLALIKGIPEKNRGTHTGFEIFLRNIQTLVDNGVLSEESAKNVISAGFSDADKTLPLDTMADNLLKLSTSNEGKYSITARREAIDVIVPQNLWKELGKAQGIKKLEPHIKGFNSEGITTGSDFSTEFLRKMYEASEDPLTKHAKIGEVYGYVIFRSKTVEPLSDKHPSYRRSIAPEQGGQPVQLDILSTPMPARQAFKKKIVQGLDISLEGATESSFKGSTGQSNQPTARGRFQPSEGFSTFTSERTATGVLLKNAAGYVISRVGSKYRVYNPYKAVIGVYDNEEQAKNRIYKEEPRR